MKGYRTYIAAALVAAFGALAALDWNPILSDPKAGVALICAAVLQSVMRSVTTTPPGAAGDGSKPASLFGHAWLGVALALTLALGGCAGADKLVSSSAGATMLRLGGALYAVECKTPLAGLIGAGVVSVASVRAPDGMAATRARAVVDAHNAAIAAICPAARAVEVVAAQL